MLSSTERRAQADRRAGSDRRRAVVPVSVERRSGEERRSGIERRTADSLSDQLRSALVLLTNVAESGTLDDDNLRDLDAAMFRLRFALERIDLESR